jgi:hypothetical protein
MGIGLWAGGEFAAGDLESGGLESGGLEFEGLESPDGIFAKLTPLPPIKGRFPLAL